MIDALLSDYTIRTVLLGSAIVGLVSGCIGSFAYLRGQSLMGDAISHATLPGIAGIFLLTGDRSLSTLLLGAALAGWLGIIVITELTHTTRVKMDSALGIVLSAFFGVGIILVTYVNKTPHAAKAGLETYLFGQAAIMNQQDIITMVFISVVIAIIARLLWKEFHVISFDPGFAHALQLPMKTLDIALSFCIVLAIVVGLQTVGVILMSAMIAVPAAAARQWTHRLTPMVVLAGAFGATAAIVGVLVSSFVIAIPTGPSIVVVITGIFVLSILVAPGRGILYRGK